MTEKTSLALPYKVLPGETIDLTVKMISPKSAGEYTGRWMLRTDEGLLFGVGKDAEAALTVKVQVLNLDPAAEYDLLLDMCQATWWNGNMEGLRCPSPLSSTRGFVTMLPSPRLENGANDRPVLWVRPNGKVQGFVAGKYPPYLVQDGDHFRTQIGCLANSAGCKLTFKFQYQVGSGEKVTLAEWNQAADGKITKVDLDLSSLAGQQVQFILRVFGENKQFESHNGFWLIPRIVNVK